MATISGTTTSAESLKTPHGRWDCFKRLLTSLAVTVVPPALA